MKDEKRKILVKHAAKNTDGVRVIPESKIDDLVNDINAFHDRKVKDKKD